jgi:uncharacterized protein RhaS with RHS repeats
MQQRYFDPIAGRMLSVDPVTTDSNTSASFNRYAYGENNPYKYVDPDGRDTELACFTKDRNDALSATIGPAPANQGWHGEQANSLNEALQLGAGAGTGGVLKGGLGILGSVFKTEARVAAASENFVYRGLAKGENAAEGLTARSPGAGNSEISHVAGKQQTQWISTTKSLEIATEKYGQNGVVRIDLNKVGSQVSDVSGGFPQGGRMSNWAKRDQEVLIQDSIPAHAITEIR